MIPHGFAAQAIARRRTDGSALLRRSLDFALRHRTAPAPPILSRRGRILGRRRDAHAIESGPRARPHRPGRRRSCGGCARAVRGNSPPEPIGGDTNRRRALCTPGAASLGRERCIPLAAPRRAVVVRGAVRRAPAKRSAASADPRRALARGLTQAATGPTAASERRRRVNVARRHDDPRLSSPPRQGTRARLRHDHRLRGPRAVGGQGSRPPSRDARESRAQGRAPRGTRQRSPRVPARGRRVPGTAIERRRPTCARLAGDRGRRGRVGWRLGGR